MILLTCYWEGKDKDRTKELITTLSNNVNNKHIEKIYLFLESDKKPPVEDEKVEFIEDFGRPTYSELLSFCNKNLEGKNCIIANTDIEFTDSLSLVSEVDLKDCFLCLSRWDLMEDGSVAYHRAADSQDSWIFKSPAPEGMVDEANFFMGQPGCDNRIAFLAKKFGLVPTNPSPVIKTIHRHLVEHRTYDFSDRLYGSYLRVYPCDDWDVSRIGLDINSYEEYVDDSKAGR